MEPEPYRDTREHLLDELSRIDLLLRARLEDWWADRGGVVDEFQGLYVSDEEVDRLLRPPAGDGDRIGGGPRAAGNGGREATAGLADRIERRTREIRERTRATIDTGGPSLRLVELAERFGLDHRDTDVLLLALAPSIDRKYEKIYAYLHDDVTRTSPSVGLVLSVLSSSALGRLGARAAVSRGSPLVRNRLVWLSGDEWTPLPSRVVRVDDRTVEYLLGLDDLDGDLADVAAVHAPTRGVDDLPVDGRTRERLERLVPTVADPGPDRPLIVVHGPYGVGKEAAVDALCAEAGIPVLRVDAGALVDDDGAPAPAPTLGSLLREARFRGAALHVAAFTPFPAGTADDRGAVDHDRAGSALAEAVRALDRFEGRVFLTGTEPLPTRIRLGIGDHEVASVDLPAPSFERRRELWRAVERLPEDVDPGDLAAKFRLSAGGIEDALATAELLSDGDGLTADAVYRGCRAQSRDTLGSLARKIEPTYGWDDIVLPDDAAAHLREVAAHVRHQGTVYADWGFEEKYSLGNGLNVLFSGPSGTGKTMAAEIIAADAGLDLYKIDLSSVVSKYIGETEKNLREIFDEAERGSAILFFDEADALFGKRSEVKDSHDRYANIEVNYLLQRVEEHDGTVILTTNFEGNIDDAFSRRIHVSVEFPRPDRASREAIWRNIYPAGTPVSDLDFEFLAGFEITGGNIKNVALTSAFLAAEDGADVGMEHVVRAVRRELQKDGTLVRPSDFGPYREAVTR